MQSKGLTMKSIIQEASSIAKAIEKAWISAGKPKDFTVKIFEEPQKNFFGFTTKLAAIGFFFHGNHEKGAALNACKEQAMPKSVCSSRQTPQKKTEMLSKEKQQGNQGILEESSDKIIANTEFMDSKVAWNQEMIDKASAWIGDALQAMHLKHVNYQLDADHYVLSIKFDKPLIENQDQERQLFKSFSFLMLQALKKTFKRPLRGFRITLLRI